MCGRMNVTDHPGVRDFMSDLGMAYSVSPQLNIAPGSEAEFVVETGEDRDLVTGYWSLMIEPKPDGKPGYRPNQKFKTFNAKSTRLEESRLWAVPFRQYRCVVPVTGFHEWKDGRCYNIRPAEAPMFALAGLYRLNHFEGDIVPSFTVITLPKQPAFEHIHHTYPFILEADDIDEWLDPLQQDTRAFLEWMNLGMRQSVLVDELRSPNELTALTSQEIAI